MRRSFRLFVQGAARTFDFGGRSGRSAFLAYIVISQIIAALVGFTAIWFLDVTMHQRLAFTLQVLAIAPLPALAVRRLHDFGFSGRWGLILIALIIRALALDGIGLLAGEDIRSLIEGPLSYIDWLLFLPCIALYVLLLAAPGTRGDNRYGPNPQAGGNDADDDRDEALPVETAGLQTSDPLGH